jgi:colicin import membrane protein
MLHADVRPAPVLETRRALNRSLLLHLLVLGVVAGLPYLHRPPEVKEPPAIQAVLVPKAVVQQREPVPVKPVAPAPAPAPEPEKVELPPPVVEPPKIVLPKPKPEKPAPAKPEKPVETVAKPRPPESILKNKPLTPLPVDDEIEALRREAKQAERQAELDRLRREVDATATAMKVSANQALVDRYRGLIANRVESKWNRPLAAKAGMSATLRISILPGGEVANVVVTGSSGNPAFDASAIEAVRRASPLPVPEDLAVFSQNFRNFTLKFRPEDL